MSTLLGKTGGVVCGFFAVLGLLSLVLPEDYQHMPESPEDIGYSPPYSHHILGKDFMGRDLFTQLCTGAYYAFVNGGMRAGLALPVLLLAAYILSRVRSESPHYDNTRILTYIRFVAFPLGVISLMSLFSMLLETAVGHSSWAELLLFAGGFSCMGWLAVGPDMETQLRTRNLPTRVLLCFCVLVLSYSVMYDGVLYFYGFGNPSQTTWGTMIGWCYRAGYAFEALHWLLPPILCIYFFSRGMLALSYHLYMTR